MKGLAAMGRPLWGKVLVSWIIGVVRIAASMSFVWVCKALVDIATGESAAPLGTYVGIMVGIMLVQVVSSVAYGWWEGMIVTKTQNEFRSKVFGHVLASEWNGREAFHSGDMVNRLEEDTRVVVDLLCTRVPDFLITLAQLIAASIFLFTLEPSLLWVLLILMPVAAIGSKMFFKTIRKLTSLIRAKDSQIQGHMQEHLQQRVLVKTLGCTDRVVDKLDDLQGEVMDNTIKRLNYNAAARSFLRVGFMAGYAAAFSLVLNILGIENRTLNNDEKPENATAHIWNYVKVNGRWYHIDATWNDNASDNVSYMHDYFMLTDEELKKKDDSTAHKWM